MNLSNSISSPQGRITGKRKWAVRLVLFLCFIGVVSALAYHYRVEIRYTLMIEKFYRDIGSVQIDIDAMKELGSEVALLDVREPKEYQVSHIQGSRNVPFKWAKKNPEWMEQIAEGKPVILYCSIGYRSGVLAKQLMETGRTDVFNLYGGIVHWFNQGNAVYRDGKEVNRIHPYSDEFGYYITRLMD